MKLHALIFYTLISCWTLSNASQAEEPKISIEVHLNRSPEVAAWEITWNASGLPGELSTYHLELQNWGDWLAADSLFLRNLQSNIELKRVNNGSLKLQPVSPGQAWDGKLQIQYRIMMMAGDSKARESFGLMPWNKKSYGLGYTSNTLFEIYQNGTPIKCQRKLRFTASQNENIVLGWGPVGQNNVHYQSVTPVANTLIAFGQPAEVLPARKTTEIEIIQFGGNPGLASKLKPKLDKLFMSFSDAFGVAGTPPKIILTDTLGGGTNVGRVMSVGYDPGNLDEEHVLLTAAHELFHEWLGGEYLEVVQPESVWFMEGFTEYLSAWYLAHTGLISQQRFVDRISEWKKQLDGNPLLEQVAFGDSEVNWRDNDGAYEQLAYNGGALLAFVTDLAIRESGHTGLSKLVKDLAQSDEPVDNSTIEGWFRKNGLAEHYEQHIESAYIIDLTQSLRAIGCQTALASTPVAYAGFSTKDREHFGIIDQLDPDSPAARAGVKIGDQIRGYWPHKPRDLDILDAKRPKLDYGLSSFPVNESIHLEVNRNGKDLEFSFNANSLDGVGHVEKWMIMPQKSHPFFQ